MIIIAGLAAVVCIVGVLMYALATNPKLVEIGRIMFAVGLFALVWHLAAATSFRIG